MADHGELQGDTVHSGVRRGPAVFADLEALGIGYTTWSVLEDEGVDKFEASWKELLDTISNELAAAGRA